MSACVRMYLRNASGPARHGQANVGEEYGRHGGAHERRFAAHVCAGQQHDTVAELDVVGDCAACGHVCRGGAACHHGSRTVWLRGGDARARALGRGQPIWPEAIQLEPLIWPCTQFLQMLRLNVAAGPVLIRCWDGFPDRTCHKYFVDLSPMAARIAPRNTQAAVFPQLKLSPGCCRHRWSPCATGASQMEQVDPGFGALTAVCRGHHALSKTAGTHRRCCECLNCLHEWLLQAACDALVLCALCATSSLARACPEGCLALSPCWLHLHLLFVFRSLRAACSLLFAVNIAPPHHLPLPLCATATHFESRVCCLLGIIPDSHSDTQSLLR
jgi:hypothetical protein